jgi:hypothetical protein
LDAHSNTKRIGRAAIALCAAAVLALGIAIAADPGSREDPLVTVGYATQLARFQLRQLPIGQELRLPVGAELVLVSPDKKPVNAAGLNPEKNVLLNLTSGERVIVTALLANQHYVNAGPSELALRLDSKATVLVRGGTE